MDANLYALELLTASKLADARADAARAALAESLAPRRPDTLALAGLALMRLGRVLSRRGTSRRRALAAS